MLAVRDLVKVYPDGTVALNGVSLDFMAGEVHVLLGENGAGKTTLARIIYGEIRPTSGEVIYEGRRVLFRGPWEAIRAGIRMIYQHFSLVGGFTVADNIALYGSRLGLSRREALEAARRLAEEYGFRIPFDARVSDLPAGIQQRVEIVKALLVEPRVLILDEPTSLVSPLDVEALFRVIRGLREKGVAILYITHKLREVGVIGDRVTVMRRGRVVATLPAKKATVDQLARLMIGERRLPEEPRIAAAGAAGERGAALRVENLRVVREGFEAVRGVSLEVRPGEILGVTGVAGNGQDELVEAIVGVLPVAGGRITLLGRDVTREPTWVRYRLGLAYLPGSRKLSLVQEMNALENLALGLLGAGKLRGPFIDWGWVAKLLVKYVEELGVVMHSPYAPVKHLSGGNQQKLALARILAVEPRVLVAVDPTHGLDIATTRIVHSILAEMRSRGMAILLVSSDLDEVLQLSDRVAVMNSGRIVSIKKPHEYTLEELGRLMGGAA
ncbi:MAG: ABC transporter ATP-binding protein [Crenarchaeota archaeon]|nr:ABC transporter ATP-binding protein [Thermoproteota archaeon]